MTHSKDTSAIATTLSRRAQRQSQMQKKLVHGTSCHHELAITICHRPADKAKSLNEVDITKNYEYDDMTKILEHDTTHSWLLTPLRACHHQHAITTRQHEHSSTSRPSQARHHEHTNTTGCTKSQPQQRRQIPRAQRHDQNPRAR